MLPSEIDPLGGCVGLVVVETALGLYDGSVDCVGNARPFGSAAVEAAGNAGAVGPVAPRVLLPPIVGAPPEVLSPPVVADPPPTADLAAACPLLSQPRGAEHAISATTRRCHWRNLCMPAPENTPLW